MSRTTYHGKRGGRNARVRGRARPFDGSLQRLGLEKKRCRHARTKLTQLSGHCAATDRYRVKPAAAKVARKRDR